jgi:Cytochrome P460
MTGLTRLFLAVSLMCLGLPAQQARTNEPQYTRDGQLLRPDNYREWIYLSSGLGMTYGTVESTANQPPQRFDNVFVTPQAYRAFLQTGTWPDKTMFALEVRSATTKGSINKGGHYQEGVVALEIHLKDQARFPATKWAFFGFDASDSAGKPFPATSACQTCHAKSGAVDETFVQFYPTLIPIAKAKGTLKAASEQ